MELFTVKQTAEILQCHPCTIYRLCARGLIPHIKKSFGIRIKLEDLEKWLKQDKIKATLVDNILKNALTKLPPVSIDKAEGGKDVARVSKTRHNYGYGSVYIRKTKKGLPRFYIDYYDRNRKRIQKLIRNATCWHDAVGGLKNAVLKEHYEECGIKEQKQPIRLREFVELFIENYSRVNKRSWKDDFYRLRKCMNFFGNVYLHEVKAIDFERFKWMKIEQGLTKTTVNHYLKILKRMFNIAVEWGYARVSPVTRVKFYSEIDALQERILSKEEEVRLLETSSEHLRPILVVALNTGMRRGELLNLTWSRIDLKQRTIHVVNAKSGRNRVIPINYVLFEVLNELEKKSEYIFPNPETGKPFKTVRRSFENAKSRAGIENLRFHDLRHTFASRLVERGVDIVRVKELLGHSTVRVTERYTHSDQEEKKKAVELLCEESSKNNKEVKKSVTQP